MTVEQIKALDTMMQKRVVADRVHRMDIGKSIFSRDGSIKGTVTSVSRRYCAACSKVHPCYLVTWESGKKTNPCAKGVKNIPVGALQIY